MQAHQAAIDIMAALKSETAEHHKRVEQLLPFFKERFSLQEYAQTLGMFLGFFEPLERKLATIAGWHTVGIDLRQRRRAHFLHADLRARGFSDADIADLPRCQHLPNLANRYHGLGCLYVLEGSRLGGQLIARELSRRFAIEQQSGSSFFHSHDVHVGEAWNTFCSAVRTYGNDPIKEHAIVKSAEDTFASLERWIREVNQNAE